MRARLTPVVVALILLPLAGCRSAYYSAWETFGKHKRDLLVDRVEDAQKGQEKAKDQFKTALERFREVVKTDDAGVRELEARYSKLKGELDTCESRAKDVSKQIADVKQVSADLFREWQGELGQYASADMRRKSEDQLRATQRRADQMIAAMERAESKMQPVLVVFRDQVLFLKHNLNARAISSLQSVVSGLENDTAKLIADMEASIKEADSFIKEMGKE